MSVIRRTWRGNYMKSGFRSILYYYRTGYACDKLEFIQFVSLRLMGYLRLNNHAIVRFILNLLPYLLNLPVIKTYSIL